MSAGLGNMQRSILAALEPSKAAWKNGELNYNGGAPLYVNDDRREAGAELVVRWHGRYATLYPGDYDLRAAVAWLALDHDAARHGWWEPGAWVGTPQNEDACEPRTDREGNYRRVSDRFRISFYRAARSLVTRGLLFPVGDDKQLRFVTLQPPPTHTTEPTLT